MGVFFSESQRLKLEQAMPYSRYWYMNLFRLCVRYIKNTKERKNTHQVIKWRCRKVRWGLENQDKTFYVIRRDAETHNEGSFSLFNSILAHLKIVDNMEKELIPVVDFKNYFVPVWQDYEKKGLENAWEYFFKQPSEYGIEHIEHSKNIILSSGWIPETTLDLNEIYFQPNEITEWNRIYQKYIQFDDEIIQFYKEYENKIFEENTRVLGVFLRMLVNRCKMEKRGTDVREIFNGYKEMPEVDVIVEDIEKKMKEWDCNKCLVVIDDEGTLQLLKERLGDKLFYLERSRLDIYYNGEGVELERILNSKCNNLIDKEQKYITEILLLARCHCIMCGRSSGVATAFIINNNRYEQKHIY